MTEGPIAADVVATENERREGNARRAYEALGEQHPKLEKFVGWPLWLGLRLRRDA